MSSIVSEIVQEQESQGFSVKSLCLSGNGVRFGIGVLGVQVFQRICQKMREISEVFEEKEGKSEKNQEFELDVKVKRSI